MPDTPYDFDLDLEKLSKVLIGLNIPVECLPGVADNLAALLEHARGIERDVV